jgi:hypothetical protein
MKPTQQKRLEKLVKGERDYLELRDAALNHDRDDEDHQDDQERNNSKE